MTIMFNYGGRVEARSGGDQAEMIMKRFARWRLPTAARPVGAALAGAALAGAAPDSAGVAATAAHRHAAAAPTSRCRRAAGRCALPKNSRMVNYV